jgi:hypothetical protein
MQEVVKVRMSGERAHYDLTQSATCEFALPETCHAGRVGAETIYGPSNVALYVRNCWGVHLTNIIFPICPPYND